MNLNCKNCHLGRRRRDGVVREKSGLFAEERRRGPDRVVLVAIGLTGIAETPTSHLSSDFDLAVVDEFDARRRKAPAVVHAPSPRPMLVDRAFVVDQHRAVPSLVVAQDNVSGW